MFEHRGRPHSPRTFSGVAAGSRAQRVLLGLVINLGAVIARIAETLDRRHRTNNRCPTGLPRAREEMPCCLG
jgi:hypothetical protein